MEVTTISCLNKFNFENKFLETVEELRLRRKLDQENDSKIKELIEQKLHFERYLENEQAKFNDKIQDMEREIFENRKTYEDKLSQLREEKAHHHIQMERVTNELKLLKEESRSLQLEKLNLEKNVKETEARLQSQQNVQEHMKKQLSNLRQLVESFSTQARNYSEVQQELKSNVRNALEANQKLQQTNRENSQKFCEVKNQNTVLKQELVPLRTKAAAPCSKCASNETLINSISSLKSKLNFKEKEITSLEDSFKQVTEKHQELVKSFEENSKLILNYAETAAKSQQQKNQLLHEKQKLLDEISYQQIKCKELEEEISNIRKVAPGVSKEQQTYSIEDQYIFNLIKEQAVSPLHLSLCSMAIQTEKVCQNNDMIIISEKDPLIACDFKSYIEETTTNTPKEHKELNNLSPSPGAISIKTPMKNSNQETIKKNKKLLFDINIGHTESLFTQEPIELINATPDSFETNNGIIMTSSTEDNVPATDDGHHISPPIEKDSMPSSQKENIEPWGTPRRDLQEDIIVSPEAKNRTSFILANNEDPNLGTEYEDKINDNEDNKQLNCLHTPKKYQFEKCLSSIKVEKNANALSDKQIIQMYQNIFENLPSPTNLCQRIAECKKDFLKDFHKPKQLRKLPLSFLEKAKKNDYNCTQRNNKETNNDTLSSFGPNLSSQLSDSKKDNPTTFNNPDDAKSANTLIDESSSINSTEKNIIEKTICNTEQTVPSKDDLDLSLYSKTYTDHLSNLNVNSSDLDNCKNVYLKAKFNEKDFTCSFDSNCVSNKNEQGENNILFKPCNINNPSLPEMNCIIKNALSPSLEGISLLPQNEVHDDKSQIEVYHSKSINETLNDEICSQQSTLSDELIVSQCDKRTNFKEEPFLSPCKINKNDLENVSKSDIPLDYSIKNKSNSTIIDSQIRPLDLNKESPQPFQTAQMKTILNKDKKTEISFEDSPHIDSSSDVPLKSLAENDLSEKSQVTHDKKLLSFAKSISETFKNSSTYQSEKHNICEDDKDTEESFQNICIPTNMPILKQMSPAAKGMLPIQALIEMFNRRNISNVQQSFFTINNSSIESESSQLNHSEAENEINNADHNIINLSIQENYSNLPCNCTTNGNSCVSVEAASHGSFIAMSSENVVSSPMEDLEGSFKEKSQPTEGKEDTSDTLSNCKDKIPSPNEKNKFIQSSFSEVFIGIPNFNPNDNKDYKHSNYKSNKPKYNKTESLKEKNTSSFSTIINQYCTKNLYDKENTVSTRSSPKTLSACKSPLREINMNLVSKSEKSPKITSLSPNLSFGKFKKASPYNKSPSMKRIVGDEIEGPFKRFKSQYELLFKELNEKK